MKTEAELLEEVARAIWNTGMIDATYAEAVAAAKRGDGWSADALLFNQGLAKAALGVMFAEIKALREENAALAGWQCPFTDGTGLTSDEGGTQYCAKEREAAMAIAKARAQGMKDVAEILGRAFSTASVAYIDLISKTITMAGEVEKGAQE